jgi:hypothetical protein
MNLRELLFRRRAPITDVAGLAEFIDQQSAFLTQKGIFEYSRARAGHYAKVLFKEADFMDALDRSRWQAYPLAVAMVGEVVEGILRPYAGPERQQQLMRLSKLILSVFDRYPIPQVLGANLWIEARADLVRRLQLIGLHPPKRAFDIPTPFARAYFDLMPIHKSLRASERPTLHNYLKVTLCNIHDELTRRMDGAALSRALLQDESDT